MTRAEYRIEIPDDGVHVRLDGLSRIGSTYSVLVTYLYPVRRGTTSAIGVTQEYATFSRTGDGWEQGGEVVLVTS